ncbi:pLS20_p028 family conjugation system transmembrane protein [Heyndrickxia sporothermodurans]
MKVGAWSWWWTEDTKDTAEFLQKHSDWLQFGSFFPFILHEIAWMLIKGLYIMTSFLEGLIPESLDLLSFLDDSGLQGIVKAITTDLVVTLMVLTIVFLGFKTVIAKEPPNFKAVGVNIFISAFLILGLPTLMNTMEDVSKNFFYATQSGASEDTGLAWNLIKDNTADIVYTAEKGFDLISNDAEGTNKNGLNPEIFKSVNMSEVITPDAIDDLDTDSEELEHLKYTLSSDGEGNYTATKIKDGLLSFFSDNFKTGYFRYPAKFTPMIVGLIGLGVAYLFTLFIFITTIIEIGIKRVVGLFVFATDLESGQRTKMVVQDILNAFLLIAFTGLSFKMYTLFLSYLASKDPNVIIYIIAIVSATFVLIKGSNTIMRYFGVDVGLKEGFGQIAGAFALGRATTGGFNKLKNLGKSRNNSDTDNNNNNDNIDQNENKDKLNNQRNMNPKSINQNNNGKLKNGINGLGKSYGYVAERGIGGIAQDLLKGSGEKLSNNLQGKSQSLADNIKNIKDSWNEGIQEGTNLGQSNKEKWSSNKTINDNASNGDLEQGNEIRALNNSLDEIKPINGANTSIDGISKDNQPTLKETPNLNGTNSSNEQILTNMKLNDAMENNKEKNLSGKLKLDSQIENSGIDNSTNTKGNKYDGGTVKEYGTNSSPKQSINHKEGNASSLKLKVDSQSFGEPNAVKQSIIQQVEKSTIGSNDAKQRIIQEVEKSSMATPQQIQRVIQNVEKAGEPTPKQIQQNVQQILHTSGIPNGTKDVVQKIVQEAQTGASSPETLKTKVIQEIEKTSFGDSQVKQTVIQDIQKAFTPTPEQLEQNIKQVFTNNGTNEVKQEKQVITNIKEEKSKDSSYFGSLFGEKVSNYENKEKGKKGSRFDIIKNL